MAGLLGSAPGVAVASNRATPPGKRTARKPSARRVVAKEHVLQREMHLRRGLGTRQVDRARESRNPALAVRGLRNLILSAKAERKFINRRNQGKPTKRRTELDGLIGAHQALIADFEGLRTTTLADRFRDARQRQDRGRVSFKDDTSIEFRLHALEKLVKEFDYGMSENAQTLGRLADAVANFRESLERDGGDGALADKVTRDSQGRLLKPAAMRERLRELKRKDQNLWERL
jgi:hypothetical protein